MPFLTFLLSRYIKSRKDSKFISTISIITVSGITLGVAVVIIALTILNGFNKIVSEKIINLNSHIKITAFGNKDLPNPDLTISKIKKEFGSKIINIEPFVSKLSIIKNKNYTEGITITGLSKANLKSTLNKYLLEGAFNDTSNYRPQIYIGKKLAEKLFAKNGDRVTVFSLHQNKIPSIDNPPSIEQFFVCGIYESGMSEYDDLNAYINIEEAKKIFGMEDEISGYNIKLADISKIDSVADKLQEFLGYPYYVRTIFKVHQNIFTWLELQKEPIPIILGLIIFVAVFNIVGTLLMIILERTSTIGILRSLGMKRKKISLLFVLHGFYLTILGTVFGNLLAYFLSIFQEKLNIISLPSTVYFVSSVPVSIEIKNYILVTSITIIISLLASLIPSIVASKIKPISAIRFD